MKHSLPLLMLAGIIGVLSGCERASGASKYNTPIVVNSLGDVRRPHEKVVTLREAIESAEPGRRITFDRRLDGKTIHLSIVGNRHTILKGEVMGMRVEPSGPISYLVGYFNRDYGASAISARKDLYIDASELPHGITVAWSATAASEARVLAVSGNLTMKNVSITGGVSRAEDISTSSVSGQPWTLARGGGIAVWGRATLTNCRIYNNRCFGDFDSSRDRGAFGGGVYADIVDLTGCVISGNAVVGGGAAGGGVYSVGGAGAGMRGQWSSFVRRCTITGNRISALFTYGAGLYSDGGGIGKSNILSVQNCTIAHNVAEPVRGLPPFLLKMGYWRGGGVYVSNGSLKISNSTIVLNHVYGVPRMDGSDKLNMAGGIAATIGNAHAVETITIGSSIVTGNTVYELGLDLAPVGSYPHDLFTGSVMHFISEGFNRFGTMDFSQILVPVGQPGWKSLNRRHYPKTGDQDDVAVEDVLNLTSGIHFDDSILSTGVDAGSRVPLFYRPRGSAVDQVPRIGHSIETTYWDYSVGTSGLNNFLAIILGRIEALIARPAFAENFKTDFESYLSNVDLDATAPGLQPHLDESGNPVLTLDSVQWYGPAATWPKEPVNRAYIEFWHRLDATLWSLGVVGQEGLGEEAWRSLFTSGALAENPAIVMRMGVVPVQAYPPVVDQLGISRRTIEAIDIGAIEGP